MRRSRRSLLPLAFATLAALATSTAVAVGTDPGLPQQWALRQIGAPAAWSTSVGAGVPIAIIDTGVELNHEDLRSQITAAVTCVDTRGDPSKCRADGADIAGHGSHVAGIAAAAANDAGISGVAPGARIVAVRVFKPTNDPVNGPGFGANTDDINAGIRWAIRNVAGKGAINLSIGDDFPIALGSAGFEDGVEEAWAAGWVPVLAAGNESNLFGLNGEEYGNLDAMVVGATGPDGEVADYSSPLGNAKWGLVAPGGNAHSSTSKGACQNEPGRCVLSTYKGGEYALLQGTSMATPHVAGAVALVMSTGLNNAAAVQRILGTANHSRDCGGGCKGRLDVAKAVAGLAPSGGGGTPTSAPPGPTDATPTTSAPSSSPSSTPTPGGRRTTMPPTTRTATPLATVATEPSGETTAPPPTMLAPPPPDGDGVVGLSVAEAADQSDDDTDDRARVPEESIALAVVALAAVAGATGVKAWRRREDAFG
ncbi:MAG TPA: S8 family serine peptidase [Acidimicrobiales bacterium]|nr:S8 family serine peptidase [Acidimicrobiales bacterium]